MGQPAARTTDPLSPHSPCAPGKCGIGSTNVIIENKLAYRNGDSSFPHGKGLGCPNHTSVMTGGSSKVMINNRRAARVNDSHACGARVVSGASKVIIG